MSINKSPTLFTITALIAAAFAFRARKPKINQKKRR